MELHKMGQLKSESIRQASNKLNLIILIFLTHCNGPLLPRLFSISFHRACDDAITSRLLHGTIATTMTTMTTVTTMTTITTMLSPTCDDDDDDDNDDAMGSKQPHRTHA